MGVLCPGPGAQPAAQNAGEICTLSHQRGRNDSRASQPRATACWATPGESYRHLQQPTSPPGSGSPTTTSDPLLLDREHFLLGIKSTSTHQLMIWGYQWLLKTPHPQYKKAISKQTSDQASPLPTPAMWLCSRPLHFAPTSHPAPVHLRHRSRRGARSWTRFCHQTDPDSSSCAT